MDSWEDNLKALASEVHSMKNRCQQRGIPFAVFIHPVPFQTPGPDRYQSLLVPAFHQNVVAYHDLRPIFTREDWIPYDGHYNPSGHVKVAHYIGRLFQSRSRRE